MTFRNSLIEFTHMKKLVLLSLGLSAVLTLNGCGVNASNGSGTKIGQVIKLSKQGLFCKTWEGQIIRGGMNAGSGGFSVQPFDFTIEGDEMAKKVEKYMEDQTEVIITYNIEGVYSAFRTESGGHFLRSITPATNSVTFKK